MIRPNPTPASKTMVSARLLVQADTREYRCLEGPRQRAAVSPSQSSRRRALDGGAALRLHLKYVPGEIKELDAVIESVQSIRLARVARPNRDPHSTPQARLILI